MKTVILAGHMGYGPELVPPRALCPDVPLSADLWGFSAMQMEWFKRGGELDDWTEWYDIHYTDSRPWHRGIKALRPHAWEWYTTLRKPLYLAETHPDVPASIRFPLDELERFFAHLIDPDEGRLFWSCQIDYMLAFALMRGYQRIYIQGHGTIVQYEHMVDHRGVLFWLGVARSMGVRVTVLEPSVYRAPLRYAYETGAFTVRLDGSRTVMGQGVLRIPLAQPDRVRRYGGTVGPRVEVGQQGKEARREQDAQEPVPHGESMA